MSRQTIRERLENDHIYGIEPQECDRECVDMTALLAVVDAVAALDAALWPIVATEDDGTVVDATDLTDIHSALAALEVLP